MIMKLDRAWKNGNRNKNGTAAGALAAKPATPGGSPEMKPAQSGAKGNATVTIEAKIDVGFGNQLYLRGEGQGLSWNHGIPLNCVDNSTWKWTGKADEQLKFKLLLNDAVWAQGENLVATPGQRVQVSPAF